MFSMSLQGRFLAPLLATWCFAVEDDGDEFSNNLLSDLGPLLQLFGERFAQQFLSQCMGWADSAVFALAPLGIITGIVGAIRVGGPSWLKAAIGRARENKGAAEIELMSSTSDEVCELWNGQAIVRAMGKPKILQIVYYLEDEADPASFQLCSLDELDRANTPTTSHLSRVFASSRDTTELQDMEQQVPSQEATPNVGPSSLSSAKTLDELEKYAPNISLNNTPEKPPYELWIWTACGIIIQISLLAFATLITRYLKLQKGDRPVKGYALPCVYIGTLLLALGMFLCASVVDKGSKEKSWSKKSRPGTSNKPNLRVLWLQSRHVVNDQCFNAFALISRGPRRCILTSHPSSTARFHLRPESGTQATSPHKDNTLARLIRKSSTLSAAGSATLGFVAVTDYLSHYRFHLATVIGVVASLSGFVVQFVGLRGCHWTVSIGQLIATSLMTVIRAIIRRGLLERPHAEPLIPNHEMDWLATRIVHDPCSFWSHFSDQKSNDKYSGPRRSPKSGPSRWTILTLAESTELLSGTWDESKMRETSVVGVRQRLGRLSKWPGPVSELAVALATAIETVMETLFPTPENEPRTYTWFLRSLYGKKQSNIRLTVVYKKRRWRLDATHLEAILSLWVFHVCEVEEARKGDEHNISLHRNRECPNPQGDWLREGETALKKLSMRVLSPDTKAARQNLDWWVGISDAQIQSASVERAEGDRSSVKDDIQEIDRHRVIGGLCSAPLYEALAGSVGHETQCCYEDSLKMKREAMDFGPRILRDEPSDRKASPPSRDLVVISNPELPLLFSQHLFMMFMWAASDEIDPISGDTNLYQYDPGKWTKFRLENSTIRSLAQEIHKTGLGSMEEVYTFIIPAFGARGKLPAITIVVELAKKQAKYHESLQQWQKATEAYIWLFQTCKEFAHTTPDTVKATILLMENFGAINFAVELGTLNQQDTNELEELRSRIMEELRAAKSDVVAAIGNVYAAEHLDGWSRSTLESLGIMLDRHQPYLDNLILGRGDAHAKVLTSQHETLSPESFEGLDINVVDIAGRTPLHYSIILGRDDTTRLLLSLGADPNARSSIDWTPLHYACWFGNEFVAWLLLRSSDLDARGSDGATPLHCAVKRGHEKLVKVLLDSGAIIQAVDSSRRSVLHWAAFHGFENIVHRLLDSGAVASARDEQGRTPLHLAAVTGRSVAATTVLLEAGADPTAKDRDGVSPQQLADRRGHRKLAKILMEWRVVAMDQKRQTPVSWASENGHDDLVKLLVERGAGLVDANAIDEFCGLAPLASAAQMGHADVVAFLASRSGVNTVVKDKNGRTPISLAAERGHENVVTILVDCGDVDDGDNNGRTPLSWAAEMGHSTIVNILIKHGKVNPDRRNNRSRTPLSLAAAAGRVDVVRVLSMREDVDANAMDDTGRTPLSFAAGEGHESVAKYLAGLDRVDANLGDFFGQSPLSWASDSGYDSIVKLLAERGEVDPDLKDIYSQSPLSWAAEKGHDNVVSYLLTRDDVEADSKDKFAQTPFWWAASEGHDSTVRIFLNRTHIDPDNKNTSGQTPLLKAAENGHDGVVNILIQRTDVDVSATDENGRTPLLLAAELGHERVVKALIGAERAGVNARDLFGRTPLSRAAAMGHESTVRALLGCSYLDVNVTDIDGRTPLWHAIDKAHLNVAELLRYHGALVDGTRWY